MRLYELVGYKKQPDYKSFMKNPTLGQFSRLAQKAGVQQLGAGGQGIVINHPTNPLLAYKIFYDRPGNQGYLDWTKFVLANPNNPYVPSLSRPIKLRNAASDDPWPKDLYMVRMEVLKPTQGVNDPRFEKYIDPKYDRTKTDTGHLDLGEEPSLFDHAMSSLRKFDKDFRKIYNYAGAARDLGPENVMFRGDQLIVTDPMA